MTSPALRPEYASCECSGEIEDNAGGAARRQRLDHSRLEAKMATAAAIERASAHPSTLVRTGASKESGNARTGTVWRKTVWIANQIARFKITPTTAAVRADKAALSDLLPRSF